MYDAPPKMASTATQLYSHYYHEDPAAASHTKSRKSWGDLLKIGSRTKKESPTPSVMSGGAQHYAVPPAVQQQYHSGYQYSQSHYGQPIYMTSNNPINGGHMLPDQGKGTGKGNTVRYTDWFGSVAVRRPAYRPGIPTFSQPAAVYQTTGQEAVHPPPVAAQHQLVAIAMPPGLCVCPTSSSGTTRAKRKKKCKTCGHKTINVRHTLTAHPTYRPALSAAIYAAPATVQTALPPAWDWNPYATPSPLVPSGLPPPTGPPPPIPAIPPDFLTSDEELDSNPPTPETVRSVKSTDSTVTLTKELPELMIPISAGGVHRRTNNVQQRHKVALQTVTSRQNGGPRSESILGSDPSNSAYFLMKPNRKSSLSSDTDDLSDNVVHDPLSDTTLSSSPERSSDRIERSKAFKNFQAAKARGRRVSIISIGEESTKSDSTSCNVIQLPTNSSNESSQSPKYTEEKLNNSQLSNGVSHKIKITENNSHIFINNLNSSRSNNGTSEHLTSNGSHYDGPECGADDSRDLSTDADVRDMNKSDAREPQTRVAVERSNSITSVKIAGERLVLLNTNSSADTTGSKLDSSTTSNTLDDYDGDDNISEEEDYKDESAEDEGNSTADFNTMKPKSSAKISTETRRVQSSKMLNSPDIIYEEDEYDPDRTIEYDDTSNVSDQNIYGFDHSSSKSTFSSNRSTHSPSTSTHSPSRSTHSPSRSSHSPDRSDHSPRCQPSLSELLHVKSILKRPNSLDTSSENDSDLPLTPVTEAKHNIQAKLRKSVQFSASDQVTLVNSAENKKKTSLSKSTSKQSGSADIAGSSLVNDLADVYSRTSSNIAHQNNPNKPPHPFPARNEKEFVPVKLRTHNRTNQRAPNHRHSSSGIPIADMSVRSAYSPKDITVPDHLKMTTKQRSFDNILSSRRQYQENRPLSHQTKEASRSSQHISSSHLTSRYDSNWQEMYQHSSVDRSSANGQKDNNSRNNILRSSKLPSPIRTTDMKLKKFFETYKTPETSAGAPNRTLPNGLRYKTIGSSDVTNSSPASDGPNKKQEALTNGHSRPALQHLHHPQLRRNVNSNKVANHATRGYHGPHPSSQTGGDGDERQQKGVSSEADRSAPLRPCRRAPAVPSSASRTKALSPVRPTVPPPPPPMPAPLQPSLEDDEHYPPPPNEPPPPPPPDSPPPPPTEPPPPPPTDIPWSKYSNNSHYSSSSSQFNNHFPSSSPPGSPPPPLPKVPPPHIDYKKSSSGAELIYESTSLYKPNSNYHFSSFKGSGIEQNLPPVVPIVPVQPHKPLRRSSYDSTNVTPRRELLNGVTNPRQVLPQPVPIFSPIEEEAKTATIRGRVKPSRLSLNLELMSNSSTPISSNSTPTGPKNASVRRQANPSLSSFDPLRRPRSLSPEDPYEHIYEELGSTSPTYTSPFCQHRLEPNRQQTSSHYSSQPNLDGINLPIYGNTGDEQQGVHTSRQSDGRKRSDTTKEKIRQAHTLPPNLGKSIFDGATKGEILEILKNAKKRLSSNPDDDSTPGSDGPGDSSGGCADEDPFSVLRHSSTRASNISSNSDSSESSGLLRTDKERLQVGDIERTDSGVGSETSKPSKGVGVYSSTSGGGALHNHRPLTRVTTILPSSGHAGAGGGGGGGGVLSSASGGLRDSEVPLCEDCDSPVETRVTPSGVMYAPLVCRRCSRRRQERREILSEIIETELKYGRDLKIIIDQFYRPIKIAGLLSNSQLEGIFLNVSQLFEVSQSFSDQLQDAYDIAMESGDEDLLTINVAKFFLQADSMMEAFEFYCTRQGEASLLLQSLEKEKELLRIFLKVSQMENTLLRRMDLHSFLMVPVQRVTKYPLLLSRLTKATPPSQPSRKECREAKEALEVRLHRMNREAKEASPSKLWRRISMTVGSGAGLRNVWGLSSTPQSTHLSAKIHALAVEMLEWPEGSVVREGKLQVIPPDTNNWTRRGRVNKSVPVLMLLVTQRQALSSLDESVAEDGLVTPRELNTAEAALVVFKWPARPNKNGLYKEPWLLSRAIVSWEADDSEYFEVTDLITKDTYYFKDRDSSSTYEWFRLVQFHALAVGNWKKRRPALPNIMMSSTAHQR